MPPDIRKFLHDKFKLHAWILDDEDQRLVDQKQTKSSWDYWHYHCRYCRNKLRVQEGHTLPIDF